MKLFNTFKLIAEKLNIQAFSIFWIEVYVSGAVYALMFMTWTLTGLADDRFVGSTACRNCHPAHFASQSESSHAKALRPIQDSPLPKLFMGEPIQERSGISFEYRPDPSGLNVTISRGKDSLTSLLQWAFGSGVQAFTPVGIRNGIYYEHRVSFYTAAGRPGRTLGHPGATSNSLERALGQPQDPATIQRCFSCHATGLKPQLDFSSMVPGIHCERCHGPGETHIKNRNNDENKTLISKEIRKLSGLSASESIAVCGECHRMPVQFSPAPEKDDPLSIRFQPIGLMASKCYLKGQQISCVSCHSPHEDASKSPDFYIQKCMKCHPSPSVASAQGKMKSSCGLAARQNCLPCHMQKKSDAEFLIFTDHRIRIGE